MPRLPTIAVVCVRSAFVHVCSRCHAKARIVISGNMTKAASSSCRPGVRVAFMLMGSAAALGKQAPLSPHVRGPICDTPRVHHVVVLKVVDVDVVIVGASLFA